MKRQSLNQGWLFYLGDSPPGGSIEAEGWCEIDLPHDWSIEGERDPENPSGASGGFFPMGRGWYGRLIDVPEAWRGDRKSVG